MGKKLYQQERVVWTAFKKFDLDGSGAIDKQELGKVLGDDGVREAMHLSDQSKLDQIFAQVDENGDGVIDFDEFFAMLRKADGGKGGSPNCNRIGIAASLSESAMQLGGRCTGTI